MEYRNLGKSPLKVSALCLGTMMFADQTDLAEARRITEHARGAGVNFIDTADVYARGESEKIVGAAIAANRRRRGEHRRSRAAELPADPRATRLRGDLRPHPRPDRGRQW